MKLKDICEISAGGTPSRSNKEFWTDGNIPWLKISDLKNKYIDKSEEYITETALKNSSAKLFSKGTVLYTIFATIGETGILNFEATTNQAIAGLKIKDKSLQSEYLYYYMKSLKEKMLRESRGVAQNNINLSILRELEIKIPNQEDQKHVIESLSKLENLIYIKKNEIDKCNSLIKSQFVEMFGDPNFNEKKWITRTVNDIGLCVAGATPSTAIKEYWENGTIPWLSSGEVNKGRIYETDTKISQKGYDNASTKLVPPKTVLIAMAGQGKTRGLSAITEIELCTNQSVCSIVNNDKVNPEYLLYFFKMQYLELRNASTSSEGRGGLNLKIIGNYKVMIPPIELQNKFAKIVEQIDKQKFEFEKSLKKLEELQASLMQEYFG